MRISKNETSWHQKESKKQASYWISSEVMIKKSELLDYLVSLIIRKIRFDHMFFVISISPISLLNHVLLSYPYYNH